MTNGPHSYNSIAACTGPSSTDSVLGLSPIPEDGRTVVVLDENVFGLATSDIARVFSGVTIVRVENVAFAGASDTQISETISRKNWQVIFITADTGGDIVAASNHISVVRFSNNNTSTDIQLSLLWRLTKTRGFRAIDAWFGKDIRLGLQAVHYTQKGKRSDGRPLHMPHPSSPDHQKWIL